MENNVFNYNGNSITLKKENGNVYVNLTEVAKSFPEKNLSSIINSQEIREYINRLSEIKNFSSIDLLKVTRGGDVSLQGTWAHQKVALRVCQKLSTDFAIMVDTKIEELLSQGYTTLDNINRKELARMILEQEEEKERLVEQNRLQERQLKESAPKVEYFETVLQSVNTYTSTQLAKEVGLKSADQLHKKLREMKVMYYQSGQWLLTAKYCGKGYTKSRTTQFTRSDGSVGTNTITVWSEAGRMFIHNLLEGGKPC